jgi:hypothetical protein
MSHSLLSPRLRMGNSHLPSISTFSWSGLISDSSGY